MAPQRLEGLKGQRWFVAGLRVLLAGWRKMRGSQDFLFGPQKSCCLLRWSSHSTPGCLWKN